MSNYYEDELYVIKLDEDNMYVYAKAEDSTGKEVNPILLTEINFLADEYDLIKNLIRKIKDAS